MTFLTTDDFKPLIKDANLARLIEDNNAILDTAIDTAIAVLKDYLFERYDMDAVLATSGSARPRQVVRWLTVITMYYLYERLPSGIMPERVRNNYTETMATLRDIVDAKMPTDLPRRTNTDTTPKLKFRYGSAVAPRSHEL